MASRRTKLTVYVDKELMTKPDELVDAVLAHMIKKELDIRARKKFLAGFMRAGGDMDKIEYIDTWVLVRDVTTFPFRFNKKEEADADTEATGDIPMDDGADGEPESGATPD